MNDKVLEEAEALQHLLVNFATGGSADEAEFLRLRRVFVEDGPLAKHVPRFVRTCRSLGQFWGFIKHKFPTYAQRRDYIWAEFQPLLDHLEARAAHPSDDSVENVLTSVDASHIQAAWSKALGRRQSDPEGAITMARSLLESACKHILDDLEVEYNDRDDLPKLYHKTAQALKLAPSQHSEGVFKQILGGCASVVQGLGSLRNQLSDSHGKTDSAPKPAPRHAELAVNLAGSMAAYLLATWECRAEESR